MVKTHNQLVVGIVHRIDLHIDIPWLDHQQDLLIDVGDGNGIMGS